MKEKVVFEINVPVELCLADPEGKEVGGHSDEVIMYSLKDGRVMFVPPTVRDQLTRLGLKPGEPFSICKRVTGEQEEELVEWVINRRGTNGILRAVENVQRKLEKAGLVLTTLNRLANNTGYQLCFAGGEIVNVFNTGRVSVQGKNDSRVRGILGLAAPATGESSSNHEISPTTHNGDKAADQGQAHSKNNGHAKLSYIMQMALQGALDATKAVEEYAEKSGIMDRNGDPFRFSNADIRAIGLSMFIEARKRAW